MDMKAIVNTLLLVSFLTASSQQILQGRVVEKNGEPLLGVNVYVKGTYDGATTDINGAFSFETYEEDSVILVASFIGFHEYQQLIQPGQGQLEVVLKEAINKLDAVVISAGSFDASDESKRVVLKSLDIVTTAGATADIPGALNTLPGTQTVGETGRLFVRGGEGRETKTYIDGMIVHNEYSPSAPNTPSRSRFSPFMFKGMSFSTGGYSAEYGQALSSALILQSKDVAAITRTDLSFMTVGVDAAHTSVWEKSSFSGKVQYTNLTPYFELAKQQLQWDKAPEEMNGNFAFRQQTSKTGLLKFYTNLSRSRLNLYESDITYPEISYPVSVSNDYAYFNATYREVLNDKWGIRTGISFTESTDSLSRSEESIQDQISGRHGKLVLDYTYSDRFAVRFGGEYLKREAQETLSDPTGQLNASFNEELGAGFVEAETFVSSKLAFKTGLRSEHNSLTNELDWSPRVSAAYKTGEKSQVSLAYGSFIQAPDNRLIYRLNTAQPEKARHYIANYQWSGEGRTFRAEGYRKTYANLARYQSPFDASDFSFDGEGYAQGLDLFWRDTKTLKDTDYWVSYSYLDTERSYKDFPGAFQPSFVSKHNFSLVGKRFIQSIRSQIGVTYTFASPRKYHNPNMDDFLSEETKNFHDFSFNVSYLYSNQVIVHAMVNNLFGFNNEFGYEYANEQGPDGLFAGRAITPPAKRFVFLGIFITLSKNKSVSQLPNL